MVVINFFYLVCNARDACAAYYDELKKWWQAFLENGYVHEFGFKKIKPYSKHLEPTLLPGLMRNLDMTFTYIKVHGVFASRESCSVKKKDDLEWYFNLS